MQVESGLRTEDWTRYCEHCGRRDGVPRPPVPDGGRPRVRPRGGRPLQHGAAAGPGHRGRDLAAGALPRGRHRPAAGAGGGGGRRAAAATEGQVGSFCMEYI